MAMFKIASAEDWPGLADRLPVEVKISQDGLLTGDRHKIASEVGDRFLAEVRKIEDQLDTANHKYAHVISCGCSDRFGPNRNADGWSAESLEKDMHTYLKHAAAYRDHRNKKGNDRFGRVKVAFFDNDRGYGRLLVELNATEKALTDRLDKIANHEIDCLDRGDSYKTSHGSRMPFDQCVICGNKAENRHKYCESMDHGGDCPLFGCKSGLSKIADDGRIQFVDNPNNTFYDISSIGLTRDSAKQADRIAYASNFDLEMLKNASVSVENGSVKGGAYLAEQLGLHDRFDLITTDSLTTYQRKLADAAVRLAEKEAWYDESLADSYTENFPGASKLTSGSASTRQAAAAAMSRNKQMIGPRQFAKHCGADEPTANLVAQYAEGSVGRVCLDDQVANLLKSSCFTRHPADPQWVASLQDKVGSDAYSMSPIRISTRMKLSVFGSDISDDTTNADNELAGEIATNFCALKILNASQIF